MNYFALSVIVLQILAALSYLFSGKKPDAIIWFLYALINLVLVFRDKIE